MDWMLVLGLVAYTLFLGLVFYFCVFADPSQSPLAYYLTISLPEKAWLVIERCSGPTGMSIIEWIVDRTLVLVYCCVVFGSWSIIFFYVIPWVSSQDYVSHVHIRVAPLVFAACVISWRKAMRSSPGIITAQTIHLYDHYPYDEWMFVSGQTCKTRNIPRLARSKFDRYKYNENIPRYDHYCGWVFNTIGEENYRWFLLFLLVHVTMCAYGTYVVGSLFYGVILEQNLLELVFFDRFTGEEIPATRWIVFQYLFHKHMMEAAVLTIMTVMTIVLGLFLSYNAWLISRGLTTNESYKWNQVQKWYDREWKRYQDAIRNGTIASETAEPATNTNQSGEPSKNRDASVVVVTDGDVTCTGGEKKQEDSSSTANGAKNENPDAVVHPGPRPQNIYDRGLVENWKEVLFPISIRKAKQLQRNNNKTKAI